MKLTSCRILSTYNNCIILLILIPFQNAVSSIAWSRSQCSYAYYAFFAGDIWKCIDRSVMQNRTERDPAFLLRAFTFNLKIPIYSSSRLINMHLVIIKYHDIQLICQQTQVKKTNRKQRCQQKNTAVTHKGT